MQYALLIYTPEPTEAPPQEAMAAEMEEYNAFGQHVRDRNAMLGGEALDSIATATTVRVVDGKTITTDGPFAETKETLGGFYLVEAADLDEAISFAAMIPGARHGCIEVRPVWDYGASPGPRKRPRSRPGTDARGDRADRGDRAVVDRKRRDPWRLVGRRPRRRRSPVPRGAGPGGRDADPGDGRLRPGRGSRPGRVHQRARDVAAAWHPGPIPGRGSRPRPAIAPSIDCAAGGG